MFRALKVGKDFSQACNSGSFGKVHSVFERAINIEISKDGRLLALLCEGGDIMSANCTISMLSGQWGNFVKVGDKVLFTPNIAYIENVAIISGISAAKQWEQLSDEAIETISKPAYSNVLALCDIVEKHIAKKAGTDYISPDYTLASLNPVDFIGLGAGLTPAGDDFLAGMLHGLNFIEKLYGKKSLHLLKITNITAQNLHRTGTISRHFLRYALKGEWGQNTEKFLVSFIKGESKELYDAVNMKLSFGASSGADELRGCLFGIKETMKDFSSSMVNSPQNINK